MPEVSEHAAGMFCWVDLATTDTAAAKAFYTQLFGWNANDVPTGESGTYTMLQKNGKAACALYAMDEAMRSRGVPPHWTSYVSVTDVDCTAGKVAELGGTLLAPPFDVMTAGRMAIVQDPTGAVVALWQPKEHHGAEVVGEPGAFCWNELYTNDLEASKNFYGGLVGWITRTMAVGEGHEYTIFQADGRDACGMMEIQEEWGDVPPNWGVYFVVEDCDASMEQAKTLGASAVTSPMDIQNVGRFVLLQDPQGAHFSIIQLKPGATS